jgi:PAS domain S-box-containing protein
MKRRDRKLETQVDGFARVVRIPRRTPSKDVVARGLPASGIKAAARSQQGPTERAARVRVLNVLSAHCDVGSAVARLTDALVRVSSPTTDAALDSLDQLRRSLGAIEARMWTFDGAQARCALLAGNSLESAAAPIAHDEDAAAIQRLRHSGTVYRRLGDVSGLEHLVPAGARSFVAAASTDHEAVSGVLIVGWAHSQPPCDERDIAYLRIAATLLARAVGASATNDRQVRPDAILDSLSDRVALVDRDGTIIAVNAAWTYFGRHHIQAADAIGVGASYFDACRRAFANGCTEAGVALAGLQAVCKGASESFETSYACDGPTERRWCVMRVTRLRRPEGGAVVAHADVTNSKATELGRHIGEELFHRVADTLAVPIWIASPDGRVIYANQHWLDSVRGVTAEIGNSTWLDALHPHDRSRAAVAFRAAVMNRQALDIEVRTRTLEGTYRWSACAAVPQFTIDGSIDRFVGLCWDVSGKRRAESAFTEIAAKLVAAQEAERSRIARDLHDDLGQQIALLATKLEMWAADPRPSRTRTESGLADTRKILQDISASVHNLAHQLHPGKLKLLGLTQTLDSLCREVSTRSDVAVSFVAHEIPSDLSEDCALCVFRVSQEALQNAVKHSGARHISVQLRGTASQLILQVTDTGRGFNPMAARSSGLGLLTMRERVELIGGRLRIEMAPGHGTRIRVTLPMRRCTVFPRLPSVASTPPGSKMP